VTERSVTLTVERYRSDEGDRQDGSATHNASRACVSKAAFQRGGRALGRIIIGLDKRHDADYERKNKRRRGSEFHDSLHLQLKNRSSPIGIQPLMRSRTETWRASASGVFGADSTAAHRRRCCRS